MSLEQARLSPLSSPKRPSRDNGQCSLSRAYIGLPDHAFRNGVQHGVRRQRRAPPSEPEDALQARRDAEKRKIDEYVQLCEKLYAKRAAGDCSAEALDLTTKILTLNPEFQSAWAFRRRILQDQLGRDQDADARQKRLEADLQLTNIALRRNPKNYSVWEHRKWVLDTMPQADWSQELALVEAYLQKDGRNCE